MSAHSIFVALPIVPLFAVGVDVPPVVGSARAALLLKRRCASTAVASPIGCDAGVLGRKLVPMLAMGLPLALAVAFGMTERAYRLNIAVVLRCIPKVMVVFVPPLAFTPDVTAIDAWKVVGMRAASCAHLNVDSLPRLFAIAVAWCCWSRTRATGAMVVTERHGATPYSDRPTRSWCSQPLRSR